MLASLIIIFLCILFSAFFSGMEIAYITANRMQIELERRGDSWFSRVLDYLIDRPRRFIITMLLGNNIALVVYGIMMENLLSPGLAKWIGYSSHATILLIQTFISTMIILFLAEFVPKALFRNFANESVRLFAFPVFIIEKLFTPISWVIIQMSSFFLRLFGPEEEENDEIAVRDELRFLLSEHLEESTEEEVETEIQIFHNALAFADIKARECMIPRNEICALEITEDIATIMQRFIETGFSKILVYRDKIDNIIGYVHAFEIFKRPPNIRSVLLPVQFVHETMPAKEALNLLLQNKKSVAVVLDEYGGTAGMLTVEDIVEELFGEIEDEHDQEEIGEHKINENEYLFSARLEVDYINDKYGFNLPVSDSYETLGGLLFQFCGDIPEEGQEVKLDQNILIAKKVAETKVEEVYVKHIED